MTPETIRLKQIEFHELCKPIIRVMCDIDSVSLPRILMDREGNVISHETIRSPELQKQYDECLRLIEELKNKFFPGGRP